MTDPAGKPGSACVGSHKPRPFRFAASLPTPIGSVGEWRDRVRRIEDFGFSSIAIADHWTDGYTLEPLSALAAAAMCTTTLRLQTAVVGNDYRHPVQLHRSAATVDLVSGGRLELGIGAGWMAGEYRAAGLSFDRAGIRIDRLAESLTVLVGLFAGEPFSFDGEHYQVRDLIGQPGCVQRPHPPIMIGGGARRMLRLAGQRADIVGVNADLRHGTGTATILDVGEDRILEKVKWVEEGLVASSRSRDDIELAMAQWFLHVTGSDADRDAVLAKLGARVGVDPAWLARAPGVLVGSVDEVADKLTAQREVLGISYIQVDAGPRSSPAIEAIAPVVQRLSGT